MRSAEPVPFVVGKIARDGRKLIVLEADTPAPFPGPWNLCAVFGGGKPAPRGG